jgi:hypothetical protein
LEKKKLAFRIPLRGMLFFSSSRPNWKILGLLCSTQALIAFPFPGPFLGPSSLVRCEQAEAAHAALPFLSASQPKLPIQTGVRSSRQPVAAAPSPPREGDGDGQRRLRRLRAPVALLAGRRTLAPLSRIHVNCSECVLWPPLQCPTHARSNSSDALTWLWLLMFRYRPRDRCLGEQQLELPQQVRFCSRNC